LSKKGERVRDSVPRNRGRNTTVLAGMGVEEMGPSLAVAGTATVRVFETYLERVLAPTLREGQVVVMDNLSAHKGERVRELVEDRGAYGHHKRTDGNRCVPKTGGQGPRKARNPVAHRACAVDRRSADPYRGEPEARMRPETP
jgi:hypothetical protein